MAKTKPMQLVAADPKPVTGTTGKRPVSIATQIVRIGRSRIIAA